MILFSTFTTSLSASRSMNGRSASIVTAFKSFTEFFRIIFPASFLFTPDNTIDSLSKGKYPGLFITIKKDPAVRF